MILRQISYDLYIQEGRQKLNEKYKKLLLSRTTSYEDHTLLRVVFTYAVDWKIIHKSQFSRES